MYISIYLCSIEERWKLVTREKEYEGLYFFFLFIQIFKNFYKYEEKHKATEKYVPALNSVTSVPAQCMDVDLPLLYILLLFPF